jgi:hypothetical protein
MSLELLQFNILSPAVLAFFLGFLSVILKSDLKLPEGLYQTVSVYLLIALGIKGGVALNACSLNSLLPSLSITLILGGVLPFIAFFISKAFGFTRVDSAALSAHYGSVSVVTFMTCQLFLEQLKVGCDKHAVALVAIMEVPGLVIGLLLAKKVYVSWMFEIKSILLSQSIFLLIGGILIGYISGDAGYQKVSAFFVDPFQGILVLFMLEMGILSASKLKEVATFPKKILFIGILIPFVNALLTLLLSYAFCLTPENATLLATMAASASYIAAPAAVRIGLPMANPAYYLTAAIVVTFPFNLCFGIPLYYAMAKYFLQ